MDSKRIFERVGLNRFLEQLEVTDIVNPGRNWNKSDWIWKCLLPRFLRLRYDKPSDVHTSIVMGLPVRPT